MSFIKICAVSLLCIFLVACDEGDTVRTDNGKDNYKVEGLANVFHVESDEYMGSIKRTVEVKLAHRLSPEQLKTVAEKVKAVERRKTDRTFIGYTLEEQQTPGYWATTHYDPELRVRILEY